MNTLATLSPLQPYVAADGTSYQSYYIPELGTYLLLRKAIDGSYSYYSCVNEREYTHCWSHPEDVPYVAQAPSGIDFSAIVLRDALQDTVNSNNAISQAITENQEKQLENQRVIRHYQQVTAERDLLTNEELRASALHVILDNPTAPASTVNVGNFPTTYPVTGIFWQQTQPVSGTFWQSIQPVSGPVTNSELRASPLPVTFPFPNKQVVTVDNPTTSVAITNAITIANQPATYPVTGSFWQSTQPVSGPLTDSQLRATPVPVSITFPATQRVILDNPTTTVTVANPVTTVAVNSLPTGLGTSSNQLIANTSLNSIDGKLTPLSTAAKQDTSNASLSSIDNKLSNPLTIKMPPTTSGGLVGRVVVASTVGTTPTLVKGSPGQVYGIVMCNTTGSAVYLNMYNKATAPVANDIPIQIYILPPNQTIQLSFPLGSTYTTGIAFTITSNVALLGILTGLLVANGVIINMEYA